MPKGDRNPDAMYGVSLVERAWVVALTRDRREFTKSFSHCTYGGVGLALAAAQAWRDEMARANPQTLRQVMARAALGL